MLSPTASAPQSEAESYDQFSARIDQMHAVEIGSEQHRLADETRRGRVYSAAHLDPLDDEINHRLHTHRLDDVESRGERHNAGSGLPTRLGNVLRAQSEQQLAADPRTIMRLARRRNWKGEPVRQTDSQPTAILYQTAGQQIHHRRADESGDKAGPRIVVNLVWRADLVNPPGIHDDDSIGQGHRLDLVVGHIDCRRRDLL